jgi:sugar phosphate isomerase/epimerase
MLYQRRDFIKIAATLTSGVALTKLIGCSSGSKIRGGQKAFGLQLYTLRNEMAKDPKGVLKQVAAFGYKQIESFEGAKGMFWGMGNTGFKSYMDELGMTIVSSHCDINNNFEQKANEAAAIGMKYLICPAIGDQKTVEGYKKAAEKFNDRGDICKKAGLRFAYHNHDYTFTLLGDQFPQDILMQNTNKDTVDYEMDVYWVVTAGQGPADWLNKYPDRFKLFHIKDRKKDAPFDKKAAFAVLGTGQINYPEFTKLAEKKGSPYFIVEQDQADIDPLMAVQQNAEYMKGLKL